MFRAILIILAGLALSVHQNAVAQSYVPDVLELDGKETLEFPPDDRLTMTGGATIEFWVQPDWTDDPGYDPVVLSNAGPQGPSYLVALLRDRDGIGIMVGDQSVIGAFDFTDGKMHHVAVIDDGTSTAVLVDGETILVSEITFAALPSAGFWIGSSDGRNDPFVGAIAGLRLWDIAVNPTQLKDFAKVDLFEAREEPHPDLGWLIGLSDFTNKDFLLMEYEN